jgi:hypothetical protein
VRGVRGPNTDDWKESLALCILCGIFWKAKLKNRDDISLLLEGKK